MSADTSNDESSRPKRRLSHVPIEPDYKSVVSTLGVPEAHRALVLIRTAVPLNCHERTTPSHRCTFAFFYDTRLTVRNLVAQTRAYCGLLHKHSTHRARLAHMCARGDEGNDICTCHRGAACKILSTCKQWLFVNRRDNTPLLPHDPRTDEAEWFESIGACAANMVPSLHAQHPLPIDIDIVADMVPVYRRLERAGSDAFYDATINAAMKQGALKVRSTGATLGAEMADEIVEAYRASTHISFLCESTIDILIETLETYAGGRLSMAACDDECGECTCDNTGKVNRCAVCNLAARRELTALLSAYDGQVQCSFRADCTCIADALIRRSTHHIIEFDAVPRTDDSTYIAMGDSIYSSQSPLAQLANTTSAQMGWHAPHYGPYYVVGAQQLKSLRKRAASAYGSYVLGSNYGDVLAEARRNCRMDGAATLVHVVVACVNSDAATTPEMCQGLVPTLAHCRRALKWLPRMGRVLLEPFCLGEKTYAKLLDVVQSMTPSNTGAALALDQDFERTMYRELQYESNKRMAMARVLAFIDDPTDFEHFARVAAALLITFGVVELAQRCCAKISERSCAEFLESLSADKERRQQRQQRADARVKLTAQRAREKAARIKRQRKAEATQRKAVHTAKQQRQTKLQRKRQRRATLPVKKVYVGPSVAAKRPPPTAPSPPPLDVMHPFTWNRTFDAARLFYADAVHDLLCCSTQ